MAEIRVEQAEDAAAVRRVNEAAFGRIAEANLVEALRQRQVVTLSLVAKQGGEIVGHILFSPVTVTAEDKVVTAVALGPMAVLPAYQRAGIGSQLVRAGMERLRQAGHNLVIVLGHPDYYPRFGFVPACQHNIRWENDVPDQVFMVRGLRPGALQGVTGIVRYQPEFSAV